MHQKKFSSDALREARIVRGYNRARLAEIVGVTRQAISLYEMGKREPGEESLAEIATTLRLPPLYFFRTPIQDFSFETPIYYRKLKRATDQQHANAHVRAKWHYACYLELMKFIKKVEPNLPNFSLLPDYDFLKLTDDALEEYAKEIRKHWKLSLGPIVGLTALLEKNGTIIFQMDVPPDIDGFSFYANGGTPFIACAKRVSATRNRFNLAHELGHLLLHSSVDEDELLKKENHDLIESQAHYLAGAFLFPKDRFLDEFYSTDLSCLYDLKKKWGMSITAILKRAVNLGIISSDEVSNFYKRNKEIRKKEPGDNEIEIEQPAFSQSGLRRILEANLMTVDDLKSELPYNNDDLAEMFCLEKEFFEPKTEKQSGIGNIIQFKPRP